MGCAPRVDVRDLMLHNDYVLKLIFVASTTGIIHVGAHERAVMSLSVVKHLALTIAGVLP